MIKTSNPQDVPYFYSQGFKTTKSPIVERLKKIDPLYMKYIKEKYSHNKLLYPKLPGKGERQETINFLNKIFYRIDDLK